MIPTKYLRKLSLSSPPYIRNHRVFWKNFEETTALKVLNSLLLGLEGWTA